VQGPDAFDRCVDRPVQQWLRIGRREHCGSLSREQQVHSFAAERLEKVDFRWGGVLEREQQFIKNGLKFTPSEQFL